MGISDVVGMADTMLQRRDYSGAIPALQEVISRTRDLTDPQGAETCQSCRFQLARAYHQTGNVAAATPILDEYLANEPRKQERLALRMVAQGLFETEDWGKIEEVARRLLGMGDLTKEDRYNANLLLGQALFRQEKWAKCVDPLDRAADLAKDADVSQLCQIMGVRALVESKNWSKLFGWLPRLYRTDAKYDITLNLTLMKAGRSRFEDDDYLNALLLYRMVLPREKLMEFSYAKIDKLYKKLESGNKEAQEKVTEITDAQKTLSELPPYEDEVTFRIGQIYAEVQRYWEGYVLFDKLYRDDRTSEIGEASMLQSVLVLYDVNERARAEERILAYLDERPDGQYARTLLSKMMHDCLAVQKDYEKVVSLKKYLESLPATTDENELALQADMHYMMAFGYFLKKDYKAANEQFGVILGGYPEAGNAADSQYYRGMTCMMQGDYSGALVDFRGYQEKHEGGVHYSAAMFREAVCTFGQAGNERDPEASAKLVQEAEAVFTKFIEMFPDDALVAEAYAMRGDIEGAKEDDYEALDRAVSDYRKAIDKATAPQQASYPAFRAAEVYKLEAKWPKIIELMEWYMDRWEEQADVAQAVFWIGQSQVELWKEGEAKLDDAINAYIDAIERFGNDPAQQGVDKIILELVDIADRYLEEAARSELMLKVKLKQTDADDREEVLKLRLEVARAMLEGEEAAAELGARLVGEQIALKITSPVSLAMMCDAALAAENAEQMGRLFDYFKATYEESDLLWHGYRAKTYQLLAAGNDAAILATIDEAQGLFGAEPQMGWAQLIKADTELKLGRYEEAEESFNMIMGIPEWRGPIAAEAMYGMGRCRLGREDLQTAHSFFQRTYLLYKSYADGEWAAKGYLAAVDCLRKLGRDEEVKKTLQAMVDDAYTKDHPLADEAREQLKKLGVL